MRGLKVMCLFLQLTYIVIHLMLAPVSVSVSGQVANLELSLVRHDAREVSGRGYLIIKEILCTQSGQRKAGGTDRTTDPLFLGADLGRCSGADIVSARRRRAAAPAEAATNATHAMTPLMAHLRQGKAASLSRAARERLALALVLTGSTRSTRAARLNEAALPWRR